MTGLSPGKDFSEIELTAPYLAKDDKRIFEVIQKLITNICDRLKKEFPQNVESEEDLSTYKIDNHT